MTARQTLMEAGLDLVMQVNAVPVVRTIRICKGCRKPGDGAVYVEGPELADCVRCKQPVHKSAALHIANE